MQGALQGKVGLVTGASLGIGLSIAVALAAEGVCVVAAARRQDRLADLVREADGNGCRMIAVGLDVTDEQACRAAVRRTVDEFGGLDILINNAGLMLLGQIADADTEDWRRMLDTNVLGLMYMTHAALPEVMRRRGTIVQMSSIAGRSARLGNGAYAATKYAVNAFSESLRQEVTPQGVRVVVMEPGIVETELRTHITQPDARDRIEQTAAAMRQLQPQDIAAAVLYTLTQPEHVSVSEMLIRPTDQVW